MSGFFLGEGVLLALLGKIVVVAMMASAFFQSGSEDPPAEIFNNGDGTITVWRGLGRPLMWLQHSHPADDEFPKAYDEARVWGADLDKAGYEDWRLPTGLNFLTGEPDTTLSTRNEFAYLFRVALTYLDEEEGIVPFGDYPAGMYWTNTEQIDEGTGEPTDFAMAFSLSYGGLPLTLG